MAGQDVDAEIDQVALDLVLLQGVLGPARDAERRGGERHGVALGPQQLGDDARQVVVVVVVDDHRAFGASAGHDVIGRQYAGGVGAGDRRQVGPAHAVGAPV